MHPVRPPQAPPKEIEHFGSLHAPVEKNKLPFLFEVALLAESRPGIDGQLIREPIGEQRSLPPEEGEPMFSLMAASVSCCQSAPGGRGSVLYSPPQPAWLTTTFDAQGVASQSAASNGSPCRPPGPKRRSSNGDRHIHPVRGNGHIQQIAPAGRPEPMLASVIVATRNRCDNLRQCHSAGYRRGGGQLGDPGGGQRLHRRHARDRRGVPRQRARAGALPVRRPPRIGRLNTGITAAQGAILAFTDDDCIPDKLWLAQILRAFRKGRTWPSWAAGSSCMTGGTAKSPSCCAGSASRFRSIA